HERLRAPSAAQARVGGSIATVARDTARPDLGVEHLSFGIPAAPRFVPGDRPDVPRRAGAAPATSGASDGVLYLDRPRRGAPRRFQCAGRPAALRFDPRIPPGDRPP